MAAAKLAPADKAALETVARFAATDTARPILCGVLVLEGFAVATDSYRLAAVAVSPAVPAGLWQAKPAAAGRFVPLVDSSGETVPATSFPQWRMLVPDAAAESTVTVAPAELRDAIARAGVIGNGAAVSTPVRLFADDGRLWVHAESGDIGSFREWMPATYTGETVPAVGLAANPKYLADMLEAAGRLADGNSPFVLRWRDELKPYTARGDGWTILLMPVRVDDGRPELDASPAVLAADYAPIPPRGGVSPAPRMAAYGGGVCKTCHHGRNADYRNPRPLCAACVKRGAKLAGTGRVRIITADTAGETVAPAAELEAPAVDTAAELEAQRVAELEAAAELERARVMMDMARDTAELDARAAELAAAELEAAGETVAPAEYITPADRLEAADETAPAELEAPAPPAPAPAPIEAPAPAADLPPVAPIVKLRTGSPAKPATRTGRRWTKDDNRKLAAELRAAGVHPSGDAWRVAKLAAESGADPIAAALEAAGDAAAVSA
jgi:hypothetical protein